MKKVTLLMMNMPITVAIADFAVEQKHIDVVFDYFTYVEETFSTFKAESEISRINAGTLSIDESSPDVQLMFQLADQTKQETHGYFDILDNGAYDPAGIVKGWAIQNAADILAKKGYDNFYVNAGGDIEFRGKNGLHPWRVGIRNPFNRTQNIYVLCVSNCGVATSGTAIRGAHIRNPVNKNTPINEIVSLTVIAKNIYEADRFATAAFAMGKRGIEFVESQHGLEGCVVNKHGIATKTSGFDHYLCMHET